MATADASGSALETFILEKFDALVNLVTDMGDEAANTAPPLPGGNSTAQLLTHCCGMMRKWSSTVNLGVEVFRDRDAEFTAVSPVSELRELAAETRAAFIVDVAQTDPELAPANVFTNRDAFWIATCHSVLLHVFEELCQHLGHAEITRDLVAAVRT